MAFLLVCLVSIYLSFQKVSLEPTKQVRYAQNNEKISNEKRVEELEFKKEESSSELSSNRNVVPESPPPPMKELVVLEEEVIVEMEATHIDVASNEREDVAVARLSFEGGNAVGSVVFDEAGFNGFEYDEGRFIIEPVGSHLELIEDLFVTF